MTEVETTGRKKSEPKPRALSVTERRQLEKLINNDFEVLKGEMKVFVGDLKRRRREEIEAEYQDRLEACNEALMEWHALSRRIRDEVEAFRQQMTDRGLHINTQDRYTSALVTFSNNVTFTIAERERALNSVDNDVNHQVMRAEQELERQRISIQRELLLTGLESGQARTLLDKMPDPRQVLLGAIQASGNPRLAAIEAIAVQEVGGEEEVPVRHAHDEQVVHIPEVVDG